MLIGGSFGDCVCPLSCSDLGYAACSLWQGKKWLFLHFFWAFWLLNQPAKAGKKINLSFDHGNVLIHLEAVSRGFFYHFI